MSTSTGRSRVAGLLLAALAVVALVGFSGGAPGDAVDVAVPPGEYTIIENDRQHSVSIESARRWVTRSTVPGHEDDVTIFDDGVRYFKNPINRTVLIDRSAKGTVVPLFPILDGRHLNAIRDGRIDDGSTRASVSEESVVDRQGFVSVPVTLTVESTIEGNDRNITVTDYSDEARVSVEEALAELRAAGYEFVELTDLPAMEESIQQD